MLAQAKILEAFILGWSNEVKQVDMSPKLSCLGELDNNEKRLGSGLTTRMLPRLHSKSQNRVSKMF